ncbi:MAG: retropepsin-like aspartic protease [Gammaproteobacteria bacterium]|nr:clan AA aspartic protease [Pseudomonadales bacterium]MCP5348117.1 clan AA aspartic protease [Pseudomonadales bacterium]
MSRSPVTLRWLASKRLSCLLAGLFLGWTGNLTAEPGVDFTSLFTYSVPLNQTGAGSFSVTASVGGVETEFLLDTGATMVTVTSSLFKKIREQGSVVQVRKVGARLASGQVEVMEVYQVERFSLGNGCELGPVEVAVLRTGGRNLLGMNALQQAAPFAVSMSPPVLGLSSCGITPRQVSLRD